MMFLNVFIFLALLTFIAFVIWRNRRDGHHSKAKNSQSTAAAEHAPDKSQSQADPGTAPRRPLVRRGWLGNLAVFLHKEGTWKGRVVLHLVSSTLRIVGLALFSLGFPLLLIPWIVTHLIAKALTRLGMYLIVIGKNILFPDADTLLKTDKRTLVLYLRAFRNVGADANKSPIPFLFFPAILTTSDEERLSAVMNQLGPFITIAEKEGVDLGAARLYVTDDKWREVVIGLIPKAQLVVFRIDPSQEQWGLFAGKREQDQWALGKSLQLEIFRPNDIPEGVWEELEIASETIAPERILLYLPFKGSDSKRAEQYGSVRLLLEKHLRRPVPNRQNFGQAKFIAFHSDGKAYLLENRRFSFFGIVNWSARTLRPVFTNIGASPPKVTVDYFRIIELTFGLIAASLILLVLSFAILIITGSLRD